MHRLLKEYKETLKKTKKLKENAPEEDRKIISGIISDLEFCIEWMETARMPGVNKPIERRGVWNRTTFMDPSVFTALYYGDSRQFSPYEEVEKRIDEELERKRHDL